MKILEPRPAGVKRSLVKTPRAEAGGSKLRRKRSLKFKRGGRGGDCFLGKLKEGKGGWRIRGRGHKKAGLKERNVKNGERKLPPQE